MPKASFGPYGCSWFISLARSDGYIPIAPTPFTESSTTNRFFMTDLLVNCLFGRGSCSLIWVHPSNGYFKASI